jgi:hypothetical protein
LPQTAITVHPQVIQIHAQAPAKPVEGEACNGCGVCCAWKPCPVGALLSRRLTGSCKALRWHDASLHYRCAMVSDPGSMLRGLPSWAKAPAARLARRWIAAGAGCDSDIETQRARPTA